MHGVTVITTDHPMRKKQSEETGKTGPLYELGACMLTILRFAVKNPQMHYRLEIVKLKVKLVEETNAALRCHQLNFSNEIALVEPRLRMAEERGVSNSTMTARDVAVCL
jgi:hypothetical protein